MPNSIAKGAPSQVRKTCPARHATTPHASAQHVTAPLATGQHANAHQATTQHDITQHDTIPRVFRRVIALPVDLLL